MKKIITVMLVALVILSLAACGSPASDVQEPAAESEESMSKEELLAEAVDADINDIGHDFLENAANAKLSYCGKVLCVAGLVYEVDEDCVELYAENNSSNYLLRAYLPLEELAVLTIGDEVSVVGETDPEVTKETETVAGTDFEFSYIVMANAYLADSGNAAE